MTPSEHRELAGEALPGERRLEEQTRPRTFEEFVGQNRLRENLRVFIAAARERGEPVDHLLFCGPPGLGKTALAHVVAREMGG
jgi:Holliday junction DNA helicase RuvB